MTETSSLDNLPERQIPDEQVEQVRDFYVELLGYLLEILARVEPLRNDGVRTPLPGAKRPHVG